MNQLPQKRGWTDRFLAVVERGGNLLPDPATLFALFALGVMLISWLVSGMGVSFLHPGTGENVDVRSLVSRPGLHPHQDGHQLYRLCSIGNRIGGAAGYWYS